MWKVYGQICANIFLQINIKISRPLINILEHNERHWKEYTNSFPMMYNTCL